MLTPEQVEALRDKFSLLAEPINRFLIGDIVRRICEAGTFTRTARYQAKIAEMLGVSQEEAKLFLEEELAREIKDLGLMYRETAELAYKQALANVGKHSTKFGENKTIVSLVNAAVTLAGQELENITQTLGMIDPYGNALPLRDVYLNCSNYAVSKVMTGAQDYQSAVREATANIAKYGVQVVDYESGVHTSLDAAVRRNVFGGMGLLVEQVEQEAHDETGCDGWEISAHEASAKDHEPYQGRQYTDAEYEALNGSDKAPGKLARRISTLNCKHVAFPIVVGVSIPQYTQEELDAMKERNAKGVEYEGKHYTEYEATQMQRALERKIRKKRQEIVAYEQDEAFADDLKKARSKYNVLKQRYYDFSRQTGLPTQEQRIEVLGFGPRQERASI